MQILFYKISKDWWERLRICKSQLIGKGIFFLFSFFFYQVQSNFDTKYSFRRYSSRSKYSTSSSSRHKYINTLKRRFFRHQNFYISNIYSASDTRITKGRTLSARTGHSSERTSKYCASSRARDRALAIGVEYNESLADRPVEITFSFWNSMAFRICVCACVCGSLSTRPRYVSRNCALCIRFRWNRPIRFFDWFRPICWEISRGRSV